jgi:hypothetical protein
MSKGEVSADGAWAGAPAARQERTMWRLLVILIVTCVVATTTVEAGKRKRQPPPPQDRFRACDLEVRENLREGGTWLVPNDIHADEARLTLSVTFSTGQTIKSVPRFLRGNTDAEKRRQLRAYLDEMHAAIAAAKDGRAWLIIASKKLLPPDIRSSEGEKASPWYGILTADIGGKCRSVALYRNVQVDQLPPEAQQELKD